MYLGVVYVSARSTVHDSRDADMISAVWLWRMFSEVAYEVNRSARVQIVGRVDGAGVLLLRRACSPYRSHPPSGLILSLRVSSNTRTTALG